MPITLAGQTFDPEFTTASERYEEAGGRDARIVVIDGVIATQNTVAEIEEALDLVLALASAEGEAALSLRPGRHLRVRRKKFTREVSAGRLTGAFTLTLEAPDPYEVADEDQEVEWVVANAGALQALVTNGSAPAGLLISIVPTGDLVNPTIGDGVRTFTYLGTVVAGATLIIDAVDHRCLLDDVDVTPYTAGEFPVLPPDGATLVYLDHLSSTHSATITISIRDRWW